MGYSTCIGDEFLSPILLATIIVIVALRKESKNFADGISALPVRVISKILKKIYLGSCPNFATKKWGNLSTLGQESCAWVVVVAMMAVMGPWVAAVQMTVALVVSRWWW